MKILVTGAGGFIGSFLASRLADSGNEVIGTYRRQKPHFHTHPTRLELVRSELSEGLHAIPPADIVIHTAAVFPNSIPTPTLTDYVRSNVLATVNLVDYCRNNRVRLCVYLSTVSAYGAVNSKELDEDAPLTKPEMYGLTKYLGEIALRECVKDFSSVCIRLPGVLGPHSFTPWLGSVLQSAMRNESITIYNADSTFNNAIDLIELGRFISSIMNGSFSGFDFVNFGAAEPMTIREVVRLIVSLTGSTSSILEKPAMKESFYIKTDKMKNLFNFQPASTKDIISRFVSENMTAHNEIKTD